MSQSDFYDWLMKIGTGWLGWTEDEVLDTSVATILRAYEGRLDLLKACFGGGSTDDPSGAGAAAPTPTPQPQRKMVSMQDSDGVKSLMRGLMGRRK